MNKRIYKIKDQIIEIKEAAIKRVEEEYKKRYPESDNEVRFMVSYVLPMFNVKNKYFAVIVKSIERYKDPDGEKHFLKKFNKYGDPVFDRRINVVIKVYVKSAYTYTIEGVGDPEDIIDDDL